MRQKKMIQTTSWYFNFLFYNYNSPLEFHITLLLVLKATPKVELSVSIYDADFKFEAVFILLLNNNISFNFIASFFNYF